MGARRKYRVTNRVYTDWAGLVFDDPTQAKEYAQAQNAGLNPSKVTEAYTVWAEYTENGETIRALYY